MPVPMLNTAMIFLMRLLRPFTGVRQIWGLVHISQLAHHRVNSVSDELSEGEQVMVKVLEIDRQGKVRLSRKEALSESEVPASESKSS